jgi:hypothetical protein
MNLLKMKRSTAAILLSAIIPLTGASTAEALEQAGVESNPFQAFRETQSAEVLADPIKLEWIVLNRESADLTGHWAERVFQWAVRNRLVDGYPDGTYKPDRAVTEAEFLKMLYRAYGAALPAYVGADWTEGPYRLAAMWNHPTLGSNDTEARLEPIRRTKVAELTAAVAGYHYNGEPAIRFALGRSISSGRSSATIEGFAGEGQLTRAEAVQWIRKMKLQGILAIKQRPETPSDESLLPELPAPIEQAVQDFVLKEIGDDGLSFIDSERGIGFEIGDTRADLERIYGTAGDADVFGREPYGTLSIHYDEQSTIDAWGVELLDGEATSIRTAQGIKPGESLLTEVLAAYGTEGYEGDEILTYLYEKKDGRFVPRTSPFEIEDPDQSYVFSFIVDPLSLNVWYVSVSTFRFAYLTTFE